jgi:hypothetical protein
VRLRQVLSPWRVAAVCLILVAGSAALAHFPLPYLWELGLGSYLQLLSLLTIIALVRSLPRELPAALVRIGDTLAPWEEPAPGRRGFDPVVLGAAVWVLSVALVLATAAYQRHPHIPDEVSYLIQARTYAHGALTVPAPPVPRAFNLDLMEVDGARMYSPFPPGWPAALALGSLLGAEWVINPVLGAINLILAWSLFARLYDRRTARLGALLLAVSPWYLFLAMSFMAHQWTLTCALVAALALMWARGAGGVRAALLSGAAVGVVTLIRPLDGVILGSMLGVWALGAGGPRLRFLPLAGFGVSAALVTALNLPYNRALTGHAFTFPVMAYFDRHYAPGVNDLGFGPNRGLGWTGLDPLPGHGAADVMINTAFNLFATNVELFGWGAGSLLFAAVAALSPRRVRSDRLLLGFALAVVAFHGLYWFSGGPDFGARYWFLTIVPLVGLSARGIELMRGAAAHPDGAARHGAPLAAAALCLVALACFVPWRAVDKYRHYRGMRPDVRALAASCGFGHALVLVQGRRHRDYASAAIYNALPPFGFGPVYAWDRSPEVRDSVERAFPDRAVWEVAGPTVTGDGYRVVAAPPGRQPSRDPRCGP